MGRLCCCALPSQRCRPLVLSLAALLLAAICQGPGFATEPPVAEDLFAGFEEAMTGAVFVGRFTVDGEEDQSLHEERYEISSAKKMEQGDFWLLTARIAYGDKDITVPIPVQVKWAGKTPVITLDQVSIPGLGTFNARVVVDGDRYAGTWDHDDVGGHLFGRITKDAEATSPSSAEG